MTNCWRIALAPVISLFRPCAFVIALLMVVMAGMIAVRTICQPYGNPVRSGKWYRMC
ncbi:hypothetical protein [Bifidobacterium dolichotidis]|uniref:hypothetical protein n=1 Tax=Bifidobacterium dolichotidis TaxID=2306976 RepID=UPI0013DDF42B|nr:hypothetical protein [Bifidobacterium dolichotidis]